MRITRRLGGTGLRDAVGCGLVGGKRRGERAGTGPERAMKATYCGQSSRGRVPPPTGNGLLRGPGTRGTRGGGGLGPGSCLFPRARPKAESSSWLCWATRWQWPPVARCQPEDIGDRWSDRGAKCPSCWENTKLLQPFLDKDPGFDMRARLQPLDKLACARCRACPVRRVHRSGVSRPLQRPTTKVLGAQVPAAGLSRSRRPVPGHSTRKRTGRGGTVMLPHAPM